MKRGLLVVVLILQFFCAEASHIVGGEFEIVSLGNYRYEIRLIIYFDEVNGLPGNKQQDISITARIFRYSDNAIMTNVILPFRYESNVEYTNDDCSIGELVTTRMFYSTEITMSPTVFNDPQGYYIIWERCCRNYNITNIYSSDPGANPSNAAGQTFYLKFPPVVMNGEPFINNTPTLNPPLTDYGCTQLPYYKDFAGTDVDGDSLVYTMVNPLSTHAAEAYPPLLPRPYPEIKWKPGFGLDNIIYGSPDLRISDDGLLTATPQFTGLYVFAVKVDEYRNGIKIGEMRRDFQMLVIDCVIPDAPVIRGRQKNDPGPFSEPNAPLVLSFPSTVDDQNRCIEVQISDTDSEKSQHNFEEKVGVRVIPISFRTGKREIKELLPTVSSATLVNGSVVEFEICLPQCSYVPNAPYVIGIVGYDDACALPLSDTLLVTVYVENPPNNKTLFTTNTEIEETLNEGDAMTWEVDAIDIDGDQIIVGVLADGFIMADVGMNFEIVNQADGSVDAQLVWDTRCDVYDFTQKTEFNITILADDADQCLLAEPDSTHFKLAVKLPGNADPLISSNLEGDPFKQKIVVTKKVFDVLTFDVFGSDADDDFIVLSVKGIDFNPASVGATFTQASANGTVESPFSWPITCTNVNPLVKDQYDFQFIVVDNANKCRLYKADTLDVTVYIEPPDNLQPALSIVSNNVSQPLVDNSLTAVLGQGPIQLALFGTDEDITPKKDLLRIELIDADGSIQPNGYEFSPVQGESILEGSFVWDADCAIFRDGLYENTYTFSFRVADDKCFNVMADTVELSITIRDVDASGEDFLPMNFVSPNGDGCNDYFSMEIFETDCGVNDGWEKFVLPPDNCTGHFVNISIYNRWGRQVFESFQRDFKWYPDDLAVGVYYYFLVYSDKVFRGSVTVKY